MLIVVDRPDRENQADLIFAAEAVSVKKINFLLNECRGFICVPMTADRAAQLELPLMVPPSSNTERTGVQFTVTTDAKNVEAFGISAQDRVKTISTLASEMSVANDLVRPGHVFPLIARDGGVLERDGHTEATVDLVRLAGFAPVGVLCEILREDGGPALSTDLEIFAQKFNLKIASISDLITYIKERQLPTLSKNYRITKLATSLLPTEYGDFKISVYNSSIDAKEHVVLQMGEVRQSLLTRVHSQCFTGNTLYSLRCDCGEQLKQSMQLISEAKQGVIIHLNQEGRGIGLTNKIKAYGLQDQGMDPVEANHNLGLPIDSRNYEVAADILKDMGITEIDLLTNSPDKEKQLIEYGINIRQTIPLSCKPNKVNSAYLAVKKSKMGHRL